ncbi:MAG: hypothetical protein ACOYPR_00515 [Saprospiraceae bacterium]
MQIKYFFLSFWILLFHTDLIGQGNWIFPLNSNYTAQGQQESLHLSSNNNGPALYFNEKGKQLELPARFKRILPNGLVLFEQDSLIGLADIEQGILIPAAYDKIEAWGPNFFEVTIYGVSAIVNRSHKVLLSYQTKPAMPFLRGPDTLLIKYGIHPDAKAFGYLKNGNPISETVATPLYPKDQGVRRASMQQKYPGTKFNTFRENGKVGLKSLDNQIALPAEYDEIRQGCIPALFAVRKEKSWGILQL